VCLLCLAGKRPRCGGWPGVFPALGRETSLGRAVAGCTSRLARKRPRWRLRSRAIAPQVESRRIVCPCRVRISTAAMSRRARELAPMTASSRLGSAFQVATCSAAPLRSMTTIA